LVPAILARLPPSTLPPSSSSSSSTTTPPLPSPEEEEQVKTALREAFLAVDQEFLSSLARDVTLVRSEGGREGAFKRIRM